VSVTSVRSAYDVAARMASWPSGSTCTDPYI
jgi:hypothetical protein